MMVKYIQDGIIKGTKDELIIFDDGTIRYIAINGKGEEMVYENCKTYNVGNKGVIRIKYGNGSSFSFKEYNTGEIDKRWQMTE